MSVFICGMPLDSMPADLGSYVPPVPEVHAPNHMIPFTQTSAPAPVYAPSEYHTRIVDEKYVQQSAPLHHLSANNSLYAPSFSLPRHSPSAWRDFHHGLVCPKSESHVTVAPYAIPSARIPSSAYRTISRPMSEAIPLDIYGGMEAAPDFAQEHLSGPSNSKTSICPSSSSEAANSGTSVSLPSGVAVIIPAATHPISEAVPSDAYGGMAMTPATAPEPLFKPHRSGCIMDPSAFGAVDFSSKIPLNTASKSLSGPKVAPRVGGVTSRPVSKAIAPDVYGGMELPMAHELPSQSSSFAPPKRPASLVTTRSGAPWVSTCQTEISAQDHEAALTDSMEIYYPRDRDSPNLKHARVMDPTQTLLHKRVSGFSLAVDLKRPVSAHASRRQSQAKGCDAPVPRWTSRDMRRASHNPTFLALPIPVSTKKKRESRMPAAKNEAVPPVPSLAHLVLPAPAKKKRANRTSMKMEHVVPPVPPMPSFLPLMPSFSPPTPALYYRPTPPLKSALKYQPKAAFGSLAIPKPTTNRSSTIHKATAPLVVSKHRAPAARRYGVPPSAVAVAF